MGSTIKFNLTAYLCLSVVLACQVLDTGIHPPCPDMIAGKALPDISHPWIEDCPNLTLFTGCTGKPCHVSNPWLAILLLSGDIQSNPGPANTCHCTVCQRKVRNNDAAVSCDSCQNWSHTNCVGILEDEYQRLISTDSFTFYCPRCTLAELPSFPSSPEHDLNTSGSTRSNTSQVSKSSGLRIVNINVNGIKGSDKRGYFQAFLDEIQPDVVIGTESRA